MTRENGLFEHKCVSPSSLNIANIMRGKPDKIWKQGFKDLLSSPQNCCEMHEVHEIHRRCPNSDDSLLPAANCVYVYATQVYIQVHPNPLRRSCFRLLTAPASFSHENGHLIVAPADPSGFQLGLKHRIRWHVRCPSHQDAAKMGSGRGRRGRRGKIGIESRDSPASR